MASSSLAGLIEQFPHKHIAVIGDIIVDKYIWGKVSRISPEAPVPVVNVQRKELMLGGSANVINNIISLGAKVSLFGVVGNDPLGAWALKELQAKGANVDGLCVNNERMTSVKTRVIANKQQVVRVDDEIIEPVSPTIYSSIIEAFKRAVKSFDVVIISDYFKGVVSENLIADINKLADKKPVLVDPKVNNFKFYKNVFMITPNAQEACSFVHVPNEENRDSVLKAGREIISLLKCDHLLITRGEHGMILFEKESAFTEIPTQAQEVADVSGAGDTVISVMALGIASKASLKDSAKLSNIASGIVVGKLGTASVNPKELLEAL